MVTWDNLDTLASFQNLSKTGRIDLKKVMSGENGAERVKNYSIPMAEGLVYNYAAKQVDDDVLEALVKLAEEAQLSEKFEELYNGAVINTGENRLVLHQLTRGQLGKAVVAAGPEFRILILLCEARKPRIFHVAVGYDVARGDGVFGRFGRFSVDEQPQLVGLTRIDALGPHQTFDGEPGGVGRVRPFGGDSGREESGFVPLALLRRLPLVGAFHTVLDHGVGILLFRCHGGYDARVVP